MRYFYRLFLILVINSLIFNTLIFAQNRSGSKIEDFTITITFVQPLVNAPVVFKAPLKYNKDFALILHMDDGDPAIHDQVMPFFKGGDGPGLFFNERPGGNSQPFKMDATYFTFDASGADLHDYVTGYLHWDNMINLWAGEFGLVSSGLTNPPTADVSLEVQRNASYTKRKTFSGTIPDGAEMHTYVIPPGAPEQLSEAKSGNLAVFNNSATAIANPALVEDLPSISGIELERGSISGNLYQQLSTIASQCDATHHYIATYFNHGFDNGEISFSTFKSQMNQIANVFGRDGDDNIWSGSSTEVFEYLRIKELATVNSVLVDNVLTLTFTGNDIPDDFRFYALTIVVEGESNIVDMVIQQPDNLSSYEFSGTNALINMKWDGFVLQDDELRAENQVTLAETAPTPTNALVAMDYVQILPDGEPKQLLRNRLCALSGINYEPGFCLPTEFLGADTSVCLNETLVLQAPASASYLWSTTETTQSITFLADTTTTIWARITDDSGSTSTDTIHITVIPLPELDLQLNNGTPVLPEDTLNVVIGDTLIFKVNSLYDSIEWSGGVKIDSFEVIGAGDYIVTTYLNTCNNSRLFTVTESSFYPEFLGQDTTLCFSDTLLMVAPVAAGYLWSTGETTQSITFHADTTAKIWAKLTDDTGGSESDTITITVNQLPQVIIQPDTITIDPRDEVMLSASGAASYLWSNDSTTAEITVAPLFNTEYFVIGTSSEGCKKMANALVIVQYLTDFYFTYDTVCFGDTTHLVSNITTNDSVLITEWDIDGDGLFNDGAGDTLNIVFAGADEHLVGMRLKTFSGAIHIIYNKVPVADYPNASFLFTNTCEGETVQFSDESTVTVGSLNNWVWDFGDGNSSNEQNPAYYYETIGSYDISLVAVSNYGCIDTLIRNMTIRSKPDINLQLIDGTPVAQEDTVIMAVGDSLTFEVISNYDSIEWGGYQTERYTVINKGYFNVVVYLNGCYNSRFFTVTETGTPTNPTDGIMNLLTPNGDGYNDLWQIKDLAGISPAKVVIYARSGNVVYESNAYDNSWNGSYNGNPLPEGCYFYVIVDFNGNVIKGTISILR
ncbi:MAG: T9SS type B sorting domain-containing protein [Bacteroidales bacterium]|nr:T9SS type B sorting domain-containing protein [Bacteroidales bacterium]